MSPADGESTSRGSPKRGGGGQCLNCCGGCVTAFPVRNFSVLVRSPGHLRSLSAQFTHGVMGKSDSQAMATRGFTSARLARQIPLSEA